MMKGNIIKLFLVIISFTFTYECMASDSSEKPKGPKATDIVTFDITIDGESAGKIRIGVFGKTVPKTAENFKQLCIKHQTEVGYNLISYKFSNLIIFEIECRRWQTCRL